MNTYFEISGIIFLLCLVGGIVCFATKFIKKLRAQKQYNDAFILIEGYFPNRPNYQDDYPKREWTLGEILGFLFRAAVVIVMIIAAVAAVVSIGVYIIL